MKTALTVLATVILTAIAILAGAQSGIFPLGGQNDLCATNPEKCALPMGRSCETPRGDTLPHGESILSFSSETGSIQQSCISKTSTCNNGARLNAVMPYPYDSCEIITEENCIINGSVIAHGSTKLLYNEGELVNGQRVCLSQSVSCNYGTASGSNEFMYENCEIRDSADNTDAEVIPAPIPPATLPPEPAVNAAVESEAVVITNSTEITEESREFNCPSPRGGSAREPYRTQTVYLENAVLASETCDETTVVCAYGSIRYGTPDNIGEVVQVAVYPTCGIREPYGCTSLCGSIRDGETIASFSSNGVAYSSSVSCDDIKVLSTCNDGVLSPAAGDYCVCNTLPPAACTAPGDIQIPHGGSLTLYQSAEVQAVPGDGSDTCVRQRRECGDGVWHDYNGTPSDFTFQYTSCTVLPPPSGDGSGGEGIPQ